MYDWFNIFAGFQLQCMAHLTGKIILTAIHTYVCMLLAKQSALVYKWVCHTGDRFMALIMNALPVTAKED